MVTTVKCWWRKGVGILGVDIKSMLLILVLYVDWQGVSLKIATVHADLYSHIPVLLQEMNNNCQSQQTLYTC